MQLNYSVCCLNFSPEDVFTQLTRKYIDSESLMLESFSGVLFQIPKKPSKCVGVFYQLSPGYAGVSLSLAKTELNTLWVA